jgi:bleomycin hydrolase
MTTAQLNPKHRTGTQRSEGGLTETLLADLRDGYRMTQADRACHNAVTNNEIKALALNRGVIRGDDGHFSHRIKTKGITNQKKSGRCWMFAGLNVLRPLVIRNHRMDEFEFSTAYLQFWDKLERANLYLESVIDLRDADYLDREWEIVNKISVHDGGWWNYLVGLIQKYGVMPVQAMPETHTSSHTDTLNEVLARLLRARGVAILDLHSNGAGLDVLRSEKHKALKEVYRLLVLNFGVPPAEFEWRFQLANDGDGKSTEPLEQASHSDDRKISPSERHTPHSFFKKYIGRSMEEFVCLYNDPLNEMYRHYRFDRANNIVGNDCMNFVNIESAPMKEIAKASLIANDPLWFAVDMAFDQSEEHGLMGDRLFDYEALFGIDLSISKADRTRFHAGASGHAMALTGVDLDAEGQPRKWLVENSWGDAKGTKGRWTLRDDWFADHVYTIIAHRSHVPASILERFKDEPTLLPAWYPGAAGLR